MKLETAKQILENSKDAYNESAQEFSASRARYWQEMESFLEYVKDGNKVLDLGCGNGRLLGLLKDKNIQYTGVDKCEQLIDVAKQRFNQHRFIVGDIADLSFQSEQFDVIFAIASLHHIPSKELRLKVLKDCYQLLKKDGYLICTVWNLWQPKLIFKYKLWPTIFNWRFKKLDRGDFFIPWKIPPRKIWRYYHAFTFRELKKLIISASFQIIDEYYTKKGKKSNWTKGYNLVIIARKQ